MGCFELTEKQELSLVDKDSQTVNIHLKCKYCMFLLQNTQSRF